MCQVHMQCCAVHMQCCAAHMQVKLRIKLTQLYMNKIASPKLHNYCDHYRIPELKAGMDGPPLHP